MAATANRAAPQSHGAVTAEGVGANVVVPEVNLAGEDRSVGLVALGLRHGFFGLRQVTLPKGENTMTAEIVGANDKAEKSYRVVLDYRMLRYEQGGHDFARSFHPRGTPVPPPIASNDPKEIACRQVWIHAQPVVR
jgi:hypothetical protein